MLSNFLKKICPSVKIISLGLLILCMLLAKSMYLISFITILTLVLILIKTVKVNNYVNLLKKSVTLLLIITGAYIIIFKEYNIFNIGLFFGKLVIIVILIKTITMDIEFREIHEGIYRILLPIKIVNVDVEKLALNIVLSIYFIKFLVMSNEKIKYFQQISGKHNFNFRHKVFTMIIYSVKQLETLQNNLKIQFYQLNCTKINVQSILILILTIVFFVVCVFKEVII